MSILKQKVLATQAQYGHSNTDIRSLVLQEIIRLHIQSRSVADKKSVMAKYGSTQYKSFMKNNTIEDSFDWKQVEKCLLDETNINKFLKGDSSDIHPKTKDFFAVYCGFEGYNSFLADSKIERKENDTSNSNSKISITVNQHGKENTSIGEIKTDNLYL